MTKLSLLLFLFMTMLVSPILHAQDLVSVTLEGFSDLTEPAEARNEIIKNLTEKISLQYIEGLIGEKKVEKSKALILNKIVTQSGRYIPYSKIGNSSQKDGKTILSVDFKLSLSSLKEMVAKEGLLSTSEGSNVILPMVSFQDKISMQSFKWWLEDQEKDTNLIKEIAQKFQKKLRSDLFSKGFYLLDPASSAMINLLPESFKQDSYKTEDLTTIAGFYQARLAMSGEVRVLKNTNNSKAAIIQVRISVNNVDNNRLVVELVRSFDAENGTNEAALRKSWDTSLEELSKDLSNQLSESLQKGTFTANLVQLAVKGNLEYKTIENFKQGLRQLPEVKSVKERLFEPGRVLFELDVSSSAQDLAKKITATQMQGVQATLASGTSGATTSGASGGMQLIEFLLKAKN